MATRTKSKTRRTSSRSRSRAGSGSSASGGFRSRMSGAATNNGIHVKTEMAGPKVARIIIEIEWAKLLSRVARKVGAKKRTARRTARTSGASASS